MRRPEEALHRQVAAELRWRAPDLLWFTVPNQRGTRERWEQAMFKALGVRAGVADLVFVLPCGRVAFIELKAPRGVSSDAQRAFMRDCEALGAPYLICRSMAEVEGALAAWGVKLRGIAA